MTLKTDTEQWLVPLLNALHDHLQGDEAFARFMESAIASASAGAGASGAPGQPDRSEKVGIGHIQGVDWIRLGQLMRQELGWEDYPAVPPALVD